MPRDVKGVWALLEKDAGSFDKLAEKCLRGVEVRRLAPLAEYNVVIPVDIAVVVDTKSVVFDP